MAVAAAFKAPLFVSKAQRRKKKQEKEEKKRKLVEEEVEAVYTVSKKKLGKRKIVISDH